MATHVSAAKRARQTLRRTAVNRRRRSRVQTFIGNVDTAIRSGDKKAAAAALRLAQPELLRAADKGVMHRNAAARKLSRLSARVKAI
ncbi:MAG: 30S ribosomal protein S20 [Rhodospirillales bacterium]